MIPHNHAYRAELDCIYCGAQTLLDPPEHTLTVHLGSSCVQRLKDANLCTQMSLEN